MLRFKPFLPRLSAWNRVHSYRIAAFRFLLVPWYPGTRFKLGGVFLVGARALKKASQS